MTKTYADAGTQTVNWEDDQTYAQYQAAQAAELATCTPAKEGPKGDRSQPPIMRKYTNTLPTSSASGSKSDGKKKTVDSKDMAVGDDESDIDDEGKRSVAVQVPPIHDVHNHSVGPGYAPQQVKDVTKTLADNVIDQIRLFDEAGVEQFVWAPIPTVVVQGEPIGIGCCGNDHDHYDFDSSDDSDFSNDASSTASSRSSIDLPPLADDDKFRTGDFNESDWFKGLMDDFMTGASSSKSAGEPSGKLKEDASKVASSSKAVAKKVAFDLTPNKSSGSISSGSSGSSGGVRKVEHDGKTYYMPERYRNGQPMTGEAFDAIVQNSEQYINTGVNHEIGKAILQLRNHPDPEIRKMSERIHPSITGINLKDANSVALMMRLKLEYPNTFFIMGEITGNKEFVDKEYINYQPEIDEKSGIHDICEFAAKAHMPIVLHWDSSDAERCIKDKVPGQGEYFDKICRLFEAHPNTEFVWAHIGGLGKYGPPGPEHEEKIREILRKYPNVKLDLSWDVAAQNYSPNPQKPTIDDPERDAHYDLATDLAERDARIQRLADVINEFPDRFIMGSDALISRNSKSISATYGLYANLGQGEDAIGRSGLFDRLRPETLRKVLSGNFETMMNRAKEQGRIYESLPEDDPNGMKYALRQMQNRADAAGRTPNKWGKLDRPGSEKKMSKGKKSTSTSTGHTKTSSLLSKKPATASSSTSTSTTAAPKTLPILPTTLTTPTTVTTPAPPPVAQVVQQPQQQNAPVVPVVDGDGGRRRWTLGPISIPRPNVSRPHVPAGLRNVLTRRRGNPT